MRQLTDAYVNNGYASTSIAEKLIRLNEQQRVISMAQISADSFISQVKVDETAVKAYYDKNTMDYQTPEQARVEYTTLSAEALMAQVTVDNGEIKKYYEEHQPEFGTQEQRQAAHILISAAAQASDADKKAAKDKAENVLQQVKQSPGKFAELAKQYSQDPGSASNGGDLGFFGHGMMVKPFDDAAFQLKTGEISGLVQSDFGFHIIKLVAIKPAKIQALDEVKGTIELKLKLQKAGDKFAELAEKFSNSVYEQSDTLKPAAELAKSPLQQSAWLSKTQAETPPWTAKALQAVFSKEVLKDKRNSSAVEIAPNTLLAVRLLEYKPASTRPLAEVSGAIHQKLLRQQALELAFKQGKATLDQLKKGEKPGVDWKAGQAMTRSQLSVQGGDLAGQVFQANAAKLPAYIGMEKAQSGYLLVRVDEVKEVAAVDDAKRKRYAQEISKLTGEELLQAYLTESKKNAKISIKAIAADENK
jgi:peptidyl-prolyl cis-trans isomerase D